MTWCAVIHRHQWVYSVSHSSADKMYGYNHNASCNQSMFTKPHCHHSATVHYKYIFVYYANIRCMHDDTHVSLWASASADDVNAHACIINTILVIRDVSTITLTDPDTDSYTYMHTTERYQCCHTQRCMELWTSICIRIAIAATHCNTHMHTHSNTEGICCTA